MHSYRHVTLPTVTTYAAQKDHALNAVDINSLFLLTVVSIIAIVQYYI